MNDIRLRAVTNDDAPFLTFIMNTDAVLNALNELPTQLEDWVCAVKEWQHDEDEEDYIICDGETAVGWLGINNLESIDKKAYLKLAAILPEHQNQGIGFAAISQIIEMLRQRNYQKLALYTDLENYKARACYQKCGFEVVETFTEEMIKPGFDDGDFVKVQIPHTNKELPYNYFDEKIFQFVSCYRKTFRLPKDAFTGKKHIFITFEGAANYAKVYLNGRLYTLFS